jgi:hypothetical protein
MFISLTMSGQFTFRGIGKTSNAAVYSSCSVFIRGGARDIILRM